MGYIFFNKTEFYFHPIYDSYYASKKGEIYSSKSNKILKLGTHTNGYLFFIIFNKTKTKNYLVHRYVFECLCGNKVVDHKDNNKKNKSIDNLQLLSQKENLNKCRCKNKTKEIQINVTIVNIFMLHVPLDSIIESVIAVGGVLLWVSSVCWDTQ